MTIMSTGCDTVDFSIFLGDKVYLGIGMGNPGVFQGYPHPYRRKPIPVPKGMGFAKTWGTQPMCRYISKTNWKTLQLQCRCQVTLPCSVARIGRMQVLSSYGAEHAPQCGIPRSLLDGVVNGFVSALWALVWGWHWWWDTIGLVMRWQ